MKIINIIICASLVLLISYNNNADTYIDENTIYVNEDVDDYLVISFNIDKVGNPINIKTEVGYSDKINEIAKKNVTKYHFDYVDDKNGSFFIIYRILNKNKLGDDKLINLKLKDIIDLLNKPISSFSLIEEPPSVFRGVRYIDDNGDNVWLYWEKRYEIYYRKLKVEYFLDQKITGIARGRKGFWFQIGNVISYYHRTNKIPYKNIVR